MPITAALEQRNGGQCELCNAHEATHAYTVMPRQADSVENQVALCDTCLENLDIKDARFHWRCLEGSIWSSEPAVLALTYRILHGFKEEAWAADLMASVDIGEDIIQWALSPFEAKAVHTDAFGNVLQNGDNVVLIKALDVKGANFTASKGTVVKRIKLVHDNTEQIEGKINDQTIVILCKFVKKS